MKTLEQIKDDEAKSRGYASFLSYSATYHPSSAFWEGVAKRYAEQAIERCAEAAMISFGTDAVFGPVATIDEQSILNIKQELK